MATDKLILPMVSIKMDWINDFDNKFNHYKELSELKSRKFHGGLEIHFADGIPHTFKYIMTGKANQPKPQEVVK